MANAKDIDPTQNGLAIDIIGMPGSGKSHFAKSALAVGKAFAFVAPEAEIMSYAGSDLEYEVLRDPEWNPATGTTKVEAYAKMGQALDALGKRDDIKTVIFDTASAGPSEAVWRAVLSSLGSVNPQTLKNPFGPYMTYPIWMAAWLDKVDLLRFRKKLNIIKLWHGQMAELEGQGTVRKESTPEGRVLMRWDEAMLPEVKGRVLPQSITKWSDLAFYSEPVLGSKPFRCRLAVVPDTIKVAKTRMSGLVPKLQEMGEVPNDFPTLLDAVRRAAAAITKGGTAK